MVAKRKKKNSKGGGRQAQKLEAVQQRGLLRKLVLVLAMVMLVSGMAYAGIHLGKSESFPLRAIQIEGGLRQLDTEQLQRVVSGELQGNFFSVDIHAIQQAVMEIPWVDHVSIRRKWPDVLRIRVTEHQPLARWGEDGLLDIRGEWFGASQQGLEYLPQLSGPDGYQLLMAQRFREMDAMLQTAGLKVRRLHVDQRRSWEVLLDNQITLKLGREHHDRRLQRFVRMFPGVMANDAEKIKVVDLRYTNGFAVRWASQTDVKMNTRGS